jgi:addiction module RelE/StbE family toxin
MNVIYHRKFLKAFEKLPAQIQKQVSKRIILFQKDPFNPLLNNHSIEYSHPNWLSINITGDYRVFYEIVDEFTAILLRVGTHSELYE